ncbi:MAG: hypothetical protein ACMG55_19990 [Microcoleus sp.]
MIFLVSYEKPKKFLSRWLRINNSPLKINFTRNKAPYFTVYLSEYEQHELYRIRIRNIDPYHAISDVTVKIHGITPQPNAKWASPQCLHYSNDNANPLKTKTFLMEGQSEFVDVVKLSKMRNPNLKPQDNLRIQIVASEGDQIIPVRTSVFGNDIGDNVPRHYKITILAEAYGCESIKRVFSVWVDDNGLHMRRADYGLVGRMLVYACDILRGYKISVFNALRSE